MCFYKIYILSIVISYVFIICPFCLFLPFSSKAELQDIACWHFVIIPTWGASKPEVTTENLPENSVETHFDSIILVLRGRC